MGNIAGAPMSPRVCNGGLAWFYRDTGQIDLECEIVDQDGAPVVLGGDDTIEMEIRDRTNQIVYSASFSADDHVRLDLTEETSEAMRPGSYTMNVWATHAGKRSTIASKTRIEVE